MNAAIVRTALLGFALLASGCAHMPPDDPSDPLEPVNRGIYKFNRTADTYVLRPVARSYGEVVPDLAQRGVSNFFNNLKEPRIYAYGSYRNAEWKVLREWLMSLRKDAA